MEVLSVRDYRNNLAASFDRAAEGEQVIIRRKNELYALVSIGNEDLSLSKKKQSQVKKLAESLRRSWQQVKQIQAGGLPAKSADLGAEDFAQPRGGRG